MKKLSAFKFITVVIFTTTCTALISCKKDKQEPSDLEKVQLNYEKWKYAKVSDYSYKIGWTGCECDGRTYEVFVVNNIVSSVKSAQGQQIQLSTNQFKTIDGLFDLVISTLKKSPYRAEINFNLNYGYPVSIDIDPVEYMMDENLSFLLEIFPNNQTLLIISPR